MSDAHRKDLSTKAKETLTPDAMKSDAQKIKEATTGTADHIAREGQTDHSKSKTQDILDKTDRTTDHTKHGSILDQHKRASANETIGDKIKHAVGMDKKDTTTH